MKTTKKLFVSCEEAQSICDKNQYGEASIFEKIKLNIRLLYCKVTRAYSKKNAKLTKTMNASNIQTISPSEKEAMKKKIQKELSK
ncbi:hypothetical protein [Aquimarina aquimarini]|uniref:hypothetical protein n=1 Tax=Aquimarina aquimarini TaxID=1191734 RepID=UPI000D54F897|nr:hypothetical protein [Aquimarina aquimarini]